MNLSIIQIRSTACILVLLTHVSAVFYITESNEFQNSLLAYINQFSRFGTPLFCVITGFLFARYFYETLNTKYFYNSRIKKILIPYILWSALYLFVVYFFSKSLFLNFSNDPLINFLSGKIFYHLYFMSTIIQFCLIFPLICLLKKVHVTITTSIALLINTFSLIYLYKSDFYFISDRAFVLNWIFYFFFGILFFKYKNLKISKILILFFILFLLGSISYEILISRKIFESTRLENLIYIPVLFTIMYNLFSRVTSKKLIKIGYYSMGIYLTHPLLILAMKKIIPSHFFEQYPTSSFVFILVLTISLCFSLCFFISKFSFSTFIITLPKK
ncbi:TPA: acyltransferase [Acinetobacter baumannii]|nr:MULTISPECIES: acyltransferase [Acinetobacter]EHU1293694.1 acyltransferase [Acinetobacter baumannii]EHU1349293.1 acyltransferase [Acinetobacter baumannii]EHU1493211.1 acyltransferase [Acinetobacter baumannii]EHU1496959.1 acyltransferase [Acinetobacter baumannii]EHU1532765.1 acyltransferase [Acinetobacter baumannii]